jgi:iron complex outermembrane receptor protein
MMIIRKNLKLFLFFGILLITTAGFAQKVKITGKVTDAGNQGIPGASIVVVGTTTGTITDMNGNYSLDVDPQSTLSFSFVGFKTQAVTVTNQTVINIQLEEETIGVDEVVVIGYGQVKKGDATGSVTAISSKDFNKGAITSPQDLLVGKSAGVVITNSGGAPGSGASIRIRGDRHSTRRTILC